ncbi:MAG: class I SAM-dependent methyltransferase [Elusimicrobia bacterium]|nr:class I SAM-dependent methyltransferase [Elusimicrobiota bacterium]
MFTDPVLKRRLTRFFDPGSLLGPPTTRDLLGLYREYRLDPRSAHPRLYESESLAHLSHAQLLALFQAMRIRREHRVLSLGEGNGAVSRVLVKTMGCRVTGVDFNRRLVVSARSLAKVHGVERRVEYLQQDVQALRLGKRRFNRLYCHETMCHWQDKALALSGALPRLERGAVVGIHDWLRGDKGSLDEGLRRLPALGRMYAKRIWFQSTLAELAGLLRRLGLEVLVTEDLTDAVDAGLRKRLAFIEAVSHSAGDRARRAARSFRAVLPAHYAYLRYGRVIARRR